MKEALIKEINNILHIHPTTHREFVDLSDKITKKTHQYVSPTTLKRLWGYLHDHNHPSKCTLNILSQYLGYTDFESYSKKQKNEETSTFFCYTYASKNLTEGDELEISWEPGRKILLRYMGDRTFSVLSSINTKLSIGDTVQTSYFMEGEPITFTGVVHNGQGPLGYTAGKISGIHIVPIEKDILPPPINYNHIDNCTIYVLKSYTRSA